MPCTSRTNAKQQWTPFDRGVVTERDEMNSDYVFLCGVMWCGYGQQEAGRELLRAALLSRCGYQHSGVGYVCERKDCPQGEIVAGTDL